MKTIPAGTGEKMQYLVHDFNDNTIRFVLAYPGPLDADRLCRAARAVVMGADILHAAFVPGLLRSTWRVHEEIADSDFFALVQTAGDPAQEAIRRALRPVQPYGKCQLHCTLVQGAQSSTVALCLSHLCVDGSDGKYLLQKLCEAYASGQATLKSGDRSPEQLYRQLSKKEMRALLRSPATGIKSPYLFPTQEAGERRMAHVLIPAEAMTAARLRAKAAGATANDLLLSACYAAYAAAPGVNASAPLSVMSMMDLRRHCPTGDSQGLSNLSGTLPTALPDGLPDSFDELLLSIAAQTKQEKANPLAGLTGLPLVHGAARSVPLPLLKAVAGRVYASVGIGLTNLGHLQSGSLALDGLFPTCCWFGGPLKHKPHMQVSAVSLDGACALAVAGQYTAADEQHILAFLTRMADAVRTYA